MENNKKVTLESLAGSIEELAGMMQRGLQSVKDELTAGLKAEVGSVRSELHEFRAQNSREHKEMQETLENKVDVGETVKREEFDQLETRVTAIERH